MFLGEESVEITTVYLFTAKDANNDVFYFVSHVSYNLHTKNILKMDDLKKFFDLETDI